MVLAAKFADGSQAVQNASLCSSGTGEWHFNLATKALSKGMWKVIVTLSGGSVHTAYIKLK